MLVLVGRSCVGKDTIQKILCEEYGMERVVTCTTRPPRDGEVDGVDYHFMKEAEYESEVGGKYVRHNTHSFFSQDLAEYTRYHVASGDTWFYGSCAEDYEDSDNKVIILNPEGLKSVRDKNLPIFAVEITSSDNSIKQRQELRGDEPEEAARRFDQDVLDFADLSKWTDTVVINWGDGGPSRCARNIYNLYQYWLSKRSESNVED